METLLIQAELETLLNSVPAMSRQQLGESEYMALARLYCTEPKRHAPGRRHADTIDFDRPAMDLVIDLVPQALAAKRSNDERAYLKTVARIGALTVAAMLQAVNDKLDGEFFEKRAGETWKLRSQRGDYLRDAEARGIEVEEIEVQA